MSFLKGCLFWLLSWTWGMLMTLYGAFVAIGLLLTKHKPYRFHYFLCFETGKNWGGMEAGAFIIVNKGASQSLKAHEAGHGLQNIIFGPLMPFLVSIPSAIRYWRRRAIVKRGEGASLPPYDSIWFEHMATSLGEKHFLKEMRAHKRAKLKIVK